MGEDARALDGGTAFEVVAGVPGALVGEVGGCIGRTQVEYADFELLRGLVWRGEDQGTSGVVCRNSGLIEDLIEWKAVDADALRLRCIFEMSLVEDVAFGVLDDEQNAQRKGRNRSGRSVDVVGSFEASGQGSCWIRFGLILAGI